MKRKYNETFKSFPKFYLNRKGKKAEISLKERSPLCYEDITNLILHASTRSSFQRKPYWCELTRCQKLSCMGVLVIEGISLDDLEECSKTETGEGTKFHCLRNLISISQAAVEVLPPKNILSECITDLYQINNTEIKLSPAAITPSHSFYSHDDILREDLQHILDSVDQFDRRKLLLNLEQLKELQYPLRKEGAKCFDDTELENSRSFYSQVKPTSPMYAIDCEMVETDHSPQELAQITIVDENIKVIYSTIVKPVHNITNYLTYYSGLTENDFVGVHTRLKDVQTILSQLLPPDAILIGHSLNNDLIALKISHPYCIDTSLIYNLIDFTRKRPSLKNATKFFLDVDIQNRFNLGHDPTEDAIAAMFLVKKKLSTFLEFGDTINGWKRNLNYTYIKPVIKEKCINIDIPKQNIFEIISKHSIKPSLILSKMKIKNKIFYNKEEYISLISENNNEDILKRISKLSFTEKLIISHIEIENKSISFKEKICVLDEQLKTLYDSLPIRYMMVVFFTGLLSVQNNVVSNGCAFIALKNS